MQLHLQAKGKLSAYARVVNAIRITPSDAEVSCVDAEPGDVAPTAGTFMVGGEESLVEQGFVAPQHGQFCVPKQTLVLIQRANGFSDHTDMENALAKKTHPGNPYQNELIFKGKKNPTTCSEIPEECKLSVLPVKGKLCPVLWSIHNSQLLKLPGCGALGSEARANVEGACQRDVKLDWQCPLTCTNVMEYAKTKIPEFQEDFACFSVMTDVGTCNSEALSQSINDHIKSQVQMIKDQFPSALSWLVNVDSDYPCTTEAVETICENHCSCEAIMNVGTPDATGICQQAKDGLPGGCSDATYDQTMADLASAANSEFVLVKDTLDEVHSYLNITEVAITSIPCNADVVKTICSSTGVCPSPS